MEIVTQLDSKYTEKIASIQKQTHQNLNEIVGRAIDLYYQSLEIKTPSALELFESTGLVGCLDTDPAVPYQTVIQEYLEQKQSQNQG
jgi:hypothetical protein